MIKYDNMERNGSYTRKNGTLLTEIDMGKSL